MFLGQVHYSHTSKILNLYLYKLAEGADMISAINAHNFSIKLDNYA